MPGRRTVAPAAIQPLPRVLTGAVAHRSSSKTRADNTQNLPTFLKIDSPPLRPIIAAALE
ncbi:hypothetical protein B7486_03020 [cyanobacterium TDX16]|nr:hypothetical protein B7486_03020 [cyanobacterium TDX16]